MSLRDELKIGKDLGARMDELMERFCDESSPQEKRGFFGRIFG